jgi:hypothetical protein
MWLKIDFADEKFEKAVLDYICLLLGKKYVPFEGVKPEPHC